MSPYVKISLGGEWKTTQAAKRQHLNPIWDQSLHFRLHGEPSVFFELWNKELLSKDDLIAAGSMLLGDLVNQKNLHQWVPLFYKEKDAGSLLCELNFFPDGSSEMIPEKTTVAQGMAIETPVQTFQTTQTTLPANVHVETQIIKEEPVYIKQEPIIHEKKIITEKPIITEKTIIYSEQPIIQEKRILNERIIEEKENPTFLKDEAMVHRELPTNGDNRNLDLGNAKVVTHTTEYRKEAPIVNKQTPEVFHKDIYIEKPIIHEKDVIHREKPVFIEKPQIVEKPILTKDQATLMTEAPVIKQEILPGDVPIEGKIHREEVHMESKPTIIKETPEIYEKRVIHETPVIQEQPIIYREKEEIVEKPEIIEKRGAKRELPVIEKTHVKNVEFRGQQENVNP
jgi:hypothetical protein